MFTAWCDYGATGEGTTIMIALAPTKAQASQLFKKRFDPFFEPGMIIVKGIPPEIHDSVPKYIRDFVNGPQAKVCTFEYTSEWHVNCS